MTSTQPRLYFFLSHANMAPRREGEQARADTWVRTFFTQLADEVRRQRPGVAEPGFMDEQLPLNVDWRGRVAEALGAAQVLVPLYSQAYFSRAWPSSVQQAFLRRLGGLPTTEVGDHVQPVLWMPLPPGDPTADDALALGADVPEYARNGLQALCRLRYFRQPYQRILERLAARIIRVAEDSRLTPSRVTIDPDTGAPDGDELPFVIGVMAPVTADLPAVRSGTPYGPTAAAWRPYHAAHALPAAEIATTTAERLGFPTEVADLWRSPGPIAERPSLVLVDPWVAETPGGRARLARAVAALPRWTVLLVVADQGDPQFIPAGQRLLAEIDTILRDDSRHTVKYAREAAAFAQLVPYALAEARRRFLDSAPTYLSTDEPPKPRPTLRPKRNLTPPREAEEDE